MNRRTARAAGLVALLMGAGMLVQPVHAVAPAPQNTCSGAFCVTFDLVTYDALAPTQPTTAAAQPTNLALRFTDTSSAVATDKSTWLAKVSAVLGSTSSKAFAVTAPDQLPLGAYVAGTAATASGCAAATDFAAACPAGSGTGLVEVGGVLPTTIKAATFGISRITTGAGGALTAELTVRIDGELLPSTTTTPLTFSPATATAGPTLTMDTRPAVTPPVGYLSAELSLNTVALNLNGLVTEAAAGAVNPPVAFVRQSPLCTTVTATLAANARGTATAASAFPQGVKDCPASPDLVSVVPDPTNPRAFTFTMKQPTAAVAGRTASLEYVFGDGAKAVAGASTSHTYPVTSPVVALVTVLDSAGARSTALQVKIGAAAVRGKQKEGNLVIGSVTDQDTGVGLGDQEVLAYRCDTRHTPISPVRLRRDGHHPVDGEVPPQDPRGQEEGLRARRVRRHRDHLEQPARALRSGPRHRRAASTGGDPQALPEAGTSRRHGHAQRQGPAGQEGQDRPAPGLHPRQVALDRQDHHLPAGRLRAGSTSSGSPAATRSRSAPWSTAPRRRCWPRVR